MFRTWVGFPFCCIRWKGRRGRLKRREEGFETGTKKENDTSGVPTRGNETPQPPPSNDDVVRTWNRKGCVHARARGPWMGRRTRDAWCGPPREMASDGNGWEWWCPRPSTTKNTVDGNVVRVDARGSAEMRDGLEWQRQQDNPNVH